MKKSDVYAYNQKRKDGKPDKRYGLRKKKRRYS